MKIVRVKYIPPLGPLIQDLQRIFPELPIDAQYLNSVGGILINPEKKRFVFVKEKFDETTGIRTHVICYTLVRDSFVLPLWIQGQELKEIDLATNPIDHWFMGHEVPQPDNPNEAPEEEVV